MRRGGKRRHVGGTHGLGGNILYRLRDTAIIKTRKRPRARTSSTATGAKRARKSIIRKGGGTEVGGISTGCGVLKRKKRAARKKVRGKNVKKKAKRRRVARKKAGKRKTVKRKKAQKKGGKKGGKKGKKGNKKAKRRKTKLAKSILD